jgi:hypothetical protein
MDSEELQNVKNEFAKSQDPPLEPCTNSGCKYTGCTCGSKCGCHLEKDSLDGDGIVHCDPCDNFKMKKKLEAAKSSRTQNAA